VEQRDGDVEALGHRANTVEEDGVSGYPDRATSFTLDVEREADDIADQWAAKGPATLVDDVPRLNR
jgi:hypothetical protein